MLKINCDKCGEELVEPGALIFSSPHPIIIGNVNKYHICLVCEKRLKRWLLEWYKKESDLIEKLKPKPSIILNQEGSDES